jgi:bifunctional DNA-binding transcriptional regulator/antitoxin component of YhaV-PrlF toxin-antitoxin module
VGVVKTTKTLQEGDTTYAHYDGSGAYMPNRVRRWLGIEEADPLIEAKRDDERGSIYRTASDLNDRDGKTFAEIADAIEKKYELVDA